MWLDWLTDLVLSPALWLGVLLALIYGGLFTVWRGGGWRQLGRDLLASLIGAAAGQLVARLLRLPWVWVGELNLLTVTLGAFAALMAGRQLRWRRLQR